MSGMISAVVLTKNEANNIERCLRSLLWCDEIVIVDDYSTDSTLLKAKKFKNIFIHELSGDFAQQRNFGLKKAKNDWIFFVDADEEVSLSLQYEITNIVGNQFNDTIGFYIKRVDELWNKKILHGESGNYFPSFRQKRYGNMGR